MDTVNLKEIDQFESQADLWWDEGGPFAPLHKINPIRIKFIRNEIINHFQLQDTTTPFTGLKILDIGCGGGLVTEPLTRLNAKVTGIDAGEKNILVAQEHAQKMNLKINYQHQTVEKLALHKQRFDVVIALEIVEHVANVELFIQSCCRLLNSNGLLIISTLNRTIKSYLLGIVAAERILRWVPKGTHQWQKFLTPHEIFTYLQTNNVAIKSIKGMQYHPFKQQWHLSSDVDVNYILSAAI